MKIPTITGIIDRRILINFKIDPEVMNKILPKPFKAKLINGYAIGGICLIRLKKIRPKFFPLPFGISSENAAHRIAVEWQDKGQTREGVYIPRRDSNSKLNSIAGGRIFPGIHHYSKFSVNETNNIYSISMESEDKSTYISIKGTPAIRLNKNSIFENLQSASKFFELGSVGYSDTNENLVFDGLELICKNWSVQAFDVESVNSSYFDNNKQFPKDSVTFDNALFMNNIYHEWQSKDSICCNTENV